MVRSIRPADLARFRKAGLARGGLRRDSLVAGPREGGAQVRARPANVGRAERRRAGNVGAGRPAQSPPVRVSDWSSTSVPASAAMRWRWPLGPTSWPSISIRGCAGGSVITPAVYDCRRSRPAGPGTGRDASRFPPVPGCISTRTAGRSARRRARSLDDYAPGPGFLEFGHRGESPPGRSSSARPAISRSISRARSTRSS